MDIVGMRLSKIEANKDNDSQISGVDVDIKLQNVEMKNNGLLVDFAYVVEYTPKIGNLKLTGSILLRDDLAVIKKLADEWKSKKLLPMEMTESILNLINATAGINGIFVARAINLAPPLVPPRITLVEQQITPVIKGNKNKK